MLSSAGGSVSKKFLPEAVKRGAVCVDNTSAFRMEPDVPLVVPEVNEEALKNHHGIIANPNCSTIQMVVALEPIRQAFGLNQIIVSTYQAASGAGQSALNELRQETQDYLDGKDMQADAKIMLNDMDAKDIKVTATCVRVPVPIAHGESIYFTVDDPTVTVDQLRAVLKDAPGVVLQDDPAHQVYPQPINAVGKRDTFVGRLRADEENPGSFNMWVVADNLLKGAAWNTVENAERLVANGLV